MTLWTVARQASLFITIPWSLLKFMSIELVMPSNCPLFLLPSILPGFRVFSKESVLLIRWAKYWSFSFHTSPSNDYSGLISLRIYWLDLLAVQGTLRESSPASQFESIRSSALSLLYGPTLTSIVGHWKLVLMVPSQPFAPWGGSSLLPFPSIRLLIFVTLCLRLLV